MERRNPHAAAVGTEVGLDTRPHFFSRLVRERDRKDFIVEVPQAPELLMPIVMTLPLQLLAYDIAVRRGCDVDQPRNLAKSVTVE